MPDKVLDHPYFIEQHLLTEGFVTKEGFRSHLPGLHTVVLRHPAEKDSVFQVQILAVEEPGTLEVHFMGYAPPPRWSAVQSLMIEAVGGLFRRARQPAPEAVLQAALETHSGTSWSEHGLSVRVEFHEAEPDPDSHDPEPHPEQDYISGVVTLSRPVEPSEWHEWLARGPMADMSDRIEAEKDSMREQCRSVLRAHGHPLAEEEFHINQVDRLNDRRSVIIMTADCTGMICDVFTDGSVQVSVVQPDGQLLTLSG